MAWKETLIVLGMATACGKAAAQESTLTAPPSPLPASTDIPPTDIPTLIPIPVVSPESMVFESPNLYINPHTQISEAIRNLEQSDPTKADQLKKIARHPQATWIGGWIGDARSYVNDLVTAATDENSLATIVIYEAVARDLGGYSGGGAGSYEEYRARIQEIAIGIGDRRAIVILEPDALAHSTAMSPEQQEARIASLKEAMEILQTQTSAQVFVDTGHPGWHSPQIAADLLRRVGAANFIINVSNFYSSQESKIYGQQISDLLGGANFLIDTSRSGNGPDPNGNWCSPPHVGLGEPPILGIEDPEAPNLIGFIWGKAPGERDGSGPECGIHAGPAGEFSVDYALELLRNSPYDF
jgi:endoglucanase